MGITDPSEGCSSEEVSDTLSEWLNSLNARSEALWLHHQEGSCCSSYDDSSSSGVSDVNSLEFASSQSECGSGSICSSSGSSASIARCKSLEDVAHPAAIDGDKRERDARLPTECRSIAHRDSELLVALTENCALGPVCYFCRYNKR